MAAAEIKRLETHVLPSVDPRKRVFTHRKPNGVYALVTPWNFPMNIPAELLAAALAAGNPAIIKPSEHAPLSALALASAVAEAGLVFGAHFVSGQCCVATERLLVHRSVHDELVDLVVERAEGVTLGDPLDDTTLMGPLNNEAVAIRMDAHVAEARAQGPRVLHGGQRETDRCTNLYYELTVIDDVTPAMDVFRNETFGPVVPITCFDTDDEGLALANDSDLGLQSSRGTASDPVKRSSVGACCVAGPQEGPRVGDHRA